MVSHSSTVASSASIGRGRQKVISVDGKVAVKIRKQRNRRGWGLGPAASYSLNPPLLNARDGKEYRFVWVSQSGVFGEWESFIFPADENGKAIGYRELSGSRKGFISPDALMAELGYQVVVG